MLVARLERRHNGVDRLDVTDDVMRSDVRERVGDVLREVVDPAQRFCDVPPFRPALERQQRERPRVAPDR